MARSIDLRIKIVPVEECEHEVPEPGSLPDARRHKVAEIPPLSKKKTNV